eukprot:12459655-Heterocapsa_arctica.AAC.1
MERIVMHKEVPAHRTCVAGQDFGFTADMARMCKEKNCFTSMAYKTTQTFKDETSDPFNSSIVKYWVDLKAAH